MKMNNTYAIGKNKITLKGKNIFMVDAMGEQDDEIARESYKFFLSHMKDSDIMVSFIINLNKAGKSSPVARKIWKKLADEPLTYRVALWGTNPVAKIIANFEIGLTKKNNMKFFNSRDLAYKWVLE